MRAGDGLGVGSPVGSADRLGVGCAADATGAALAIGWGPAGCALPEAGRERDGDGVASADAGDGTGLPGDTGLGDGVGSPDCTWERGGSLFPVI